MCDGGFRFNDGSCIDNVDTLYPGMVGREGVMRMVVKKWGNSASVRIPAALMEAARLHLDQPVEMREEAGRIVIEPIREEIDDLAMLVAGITDHNRHDAVDMGSPVGREAW